MKIKGDQSTTRAMNRRLILNLLRREGMKSRAEIAAATGLSPAAVTFVVGDLLEEGLLVEGKSVAGSQGRRPIPVGINYDGGVALGFKLMVGSVECVVTDLETTPLGSLRLPLPAHDPETIVDTLAKAAPDLIALADRPAARLMGIGISIPGVIDNQRAVCVRSNRYDWDNVPLGDLVAKRLGVPVWLEDDTNAYAIAQQLFGLGRHHRTMGVLAIGVGIACALVLEGKLYRGANGAAGKFGHIPYEEGGRLCECGKRGCLMSYFSEPAILRTWRERSGRKETDGRAELVAALAAGENAAHAVVREAGETIGRYLAGAMNVVDPEVIVVGGEAVAYGEALFEPLRAALSRYAFRTAPPVLPDWEDNSWARGAAALVTQKLFDFETTAGNAEAGGHE
ncbi:ROK family protein [Shinella sp. BYT-45]|uniref:ROK family transcriptional regulator n=1 Tax=Shinella sp. BYT-45 TaxID=3377377 RepID=UPI00398048CB